MSMNYNGGFGYLSLDNGFYILCFKPCMFVPWNVFFEKETYVYFVRQSTNEDKTNEDKTSLKTF